MEQTGVGDEERACRDCRETFVFTAGEQSFYAEKGFTPPNRCKPCRDKRKAEREAGGGAGNGGNGGGGYNVRRAPSEPIREYRGSRSPQFEAQPPPAEAPRPDRKRRGKGRRKRRDDEFGGVDW